MKKLASIQVFLTILVFLYSNYSCSESTSQSTYYHFESNLQDQIYFIDLMISDTNGTMFFDASFLSFPYYLMGRKIDATGKWKFQTFQEDFIIEFQLKNNSLEDLYVQSRREGRIQLPPPVLTWNKGNVPFKILDFRLKTKLIPEMQDSPTAEYFIQFADPQWIFSPEVNSDLRRMLLTKYIGEEPIQEKASAVITNYFDRMKKQYIEEYRDSFDPVTSATYGYEEFIASPIICCNTSYLLSIGIEKYVYTGGAHGLEAIQFLNYNLKTQKTIELADLFDLTNDSIVNKIHQLIVEKLKENYDLQPSQPLTDAGFFQDEIRLPNEFALTPTGFTFVYQVYEIAPYAMGIIHVHLHWKDIKSLMGENICKLPTEWFIDF